MFELIGFVILVLLLLSVGTFFAVLAHFWPLRHQLADLAQAMTSYYGVLATNLAVPEAAAAQESGPASVDRQADLVRAGVPVEELDIAVGADKIEILRQRLKEFYAAGVVPAYLYQAHMAELDAEETAEAMLSGEGGQRTD